MPYTPEELAWLQGGIPSVPEASSSIEPPEENGGILRTGKQILNLVPKVLNTVGRRLSNVSEFFNPGEGVEVPSAPTFDVGPNQGFTDIFVNDVLPEIPATVAEFMIPATKVAGAARAIGGVGKASSVIASGLGEAAGAAATLPNLDNTFANIAKTEGVSLADYIKPSPNVSATDAAAFGFASGALTEALPRVQRVLPLAAISAGYAAKTGDIAGAIGGIIGNIFPRAFEAVTTPRLNPSKFDNLLNEVQGNAPTASRQNPGDFSFIDEVPVTPRSPIDTTGDLFNPATSEIRLDRSPIQPELNLEPNLPLSGLRQSFDDAPLQPEIPSRIPSEQTDFILEGQAYRDQPLSPLIELQSQRQAPIPPYQFLEETPIRRIDNTADLFDAKNGTKPPAEVQGDLFEQPVKPVSFSSIEESIHAKHAAAPAWTKPGEGLPQGYTGPAFEYGKTFKTADDVAEAYAQSKTLSDEGMRMLDDPNTNIETGFAKAQELISKAQYLKEAAEYAEGLPSKVAIFRSKFDPNYKPSVPGAAYNEAFPAAKVEPDLSPVLWDKADNEILAEGPRGVTKHADIKNDAMNKIAGKRDDFDPFDDIVHGFKDAEGKQLSRVNAGKYAIDNNLLNEAGLAKAELAKKSGQPFSLDSQDLKVKDTAPNLQSAKEFNTQIKEIEAQAAVARAEGKIRYAETLEADVRALTTKGVEAAEGSLLLRSSREAANVSPETAALLAVGGLGALIAYKESEGDIGTTLAAGLLTAGLGIAGVKSFQSLKALTGPKASAQQAMFPHAPRSPKEKLKRFARETARTPGGFAVMGRGGIWANAVRMAEGMAGLNVNEIFRDKKILAQGFISDQLEVLQKAIDGVKGIKPTEAFSKASERFLRGQLADKVDVENIIRAGNGIKASDWHNLTKQQKAAFPEKWMVLDDPKNTNTTGPGVSVYHVTNSTKKQLNQLQRDALKRQATSPEDVEFMAMSLTARETIDNLMGVVHQAVPQGQRLNQILGTMGQYMSRSHELLTNPKYYPTDVEIGRAMDRLAFIKEERFIESLPIASGTGATIEHGGKRYTVDPATANEFKNLHSPEELRQLVSQYIQEIKQIAAGNKLGILSKDTEQLGSSIFTGRKELDEVTQALLGTHKAPVEAIQNTINRLIPSARAGHFMKDLINLTDEATGLKFSYGSALEYNKAVNSIKDAISQATDPKILTDLDTRLKELSSYIPVSGQNAKMGLFKGAYLSRIAHDQLAGFNNPFGLLDNSIGRGLSSFNQIIKETKLVANPIVHMRNMLQIPFFLAMGNAAANPAVWKSAHEAMKNPLSSIGRRLTQNGVFIGNVVQGEFRHSLQELLNGTADKTIWNLLKKGRETANQLYAIPDNFVRASTYLQAELRAAKKFGVSVDAADPRVMQEARLFMSRRTMDYANVPQWVKTGRQIPFVSMFLTYTHEIMRIGKNLAVDAMKGDLQAGATLAGISTIPFLLQMGAENGLSKKDLKDWNKVKSAAQDYSRPRFKLPTSRNKDGTFNYIDITPLFPFNDFQMMARSAAKGDMEAVTAVNPFVGLEKTPMLSMLSEQITGKERHTAKEFRDGWDRTLSIARQLAPPHTPGIGTEYTKIAPESAGGKLGQTNLKTGRTNTIKGALLRHATGIDYTQVNPNITIKNAIRSAQHEMANEKQYLRDVLLTDGISDEAKKRAEQRYLEAVHNIREHLETQLNRN